MCDDKANVVEPRGHSNTEVFANVAQVVPVTRKATFRVHSDSTGPAKGYRVLSYKYTNFTRGLRREALDGRSPARTPPKLVKTGPVMLTTTIPFNPADILVSYIFNNNAVRVNQNVVKPSGNKGGRFTWRTVKPVDGSPKTPVCTENADDGSIIQQTCCSTDPGDFGCATGDPPCVPEPCPGEESQALVSEDNVGQPSPPIPTVSEWGLIVMALLLLTAGTIVLGRRNRTVAM
ncbi:MAG: IPTL-CTERM sorting domain-containing protein [Phycisphaerales bacterium]|nr:IPTL-CTERM sorting domain-containing protein [Phycisphaerales bacterium]